MTTQWRHTVIDLATRKTYKFVGERNDESAIKKFLALERAEWESEPVKVCPTCGQEIIKG